MVVTTQSATPLEAVRIEPCAGGRTSCVWLRRDIERDVADMGPDGTAAIEFWQAEELSFTAEGVPTVEEVTASFDELWAAHGHDGMTDAERLAALEQAQADNMAALLEIGDLLGGE